MKTSKTVLMFAALAVWFAGIGSAQTRPETATIHVYRPHTKIMAAAVHPSIYCDGVELERLHNGDSFAVTFPTGKHMITAGRSEVGQFVDFESGKDYYFRFGHKNMLLSGFSGSQPITLLQVSEDEARTEMKKLKQK